MRALITVLLFIAATPSFAAEATITDGDTLILNGTIYRLDGIDAPEPDQMCVDEKGALWACGIEARDQLKKFVGNRGVRCDDMGPDTSNPKSKRRIGICWIEGDTTMSLNQWLVREGWALKLEPYAKGRFKADEDNARDNRRGLWKGCFAAPRDHRRGNKKKAKLLGAACPAGNDKEVRDLLFPDHPAMPLGCSIKGGRSGIYHMEGCRSYQHTTKPIRWFCSEDEARAAGFRRANNCPKE